MVDFTSAFAPSLQQQLVGHPLRQYDAGATGTHERRAKSEKRQLVVQDPPYQLLRRLSWRTLSARGVLGRRPVLLLFSPNGKAHIKPFKSLRENGEKPLSSLIGSPRCDTGMVGVDPALVLCCQVMNTNWRWANSAAIFMCVAGEMNGRAQEINAHRPSR